MVRRAVLIATLAGAGCGHSALSPSPVEVTYRGQLSWTANGAQFHDQAAEFRVFGREVSGEILFQPPSGPATLPISGDTAYPLCGVLHSLTSEVKAGGGTLSYRSQILTQYCGIWVLGGTLTR